MATSTGSAPNTGVFMQHDVAPALASPLLRQLCENWARLNASAEARAGVRRWAAAHESISGLGTPGQILDHISASNPTIKDQVLRVLLDLVREGDRLAGQVLLHTMLPLLTEMPRSIRPPRGEEGYEETLQRVLAEFWEVIIADRKLTRPGVAGRLRMDTLHRITSHRRSRDVWEEYVCYDEALEDHLDATPADDNAGLYLVPNSPAHQHDLDPQGDLASVLLWMRDCGEFTGEEARFFGEVYLVSGGDQKAAAERLKLSHAATRQRITRLRNRLCAAVAAEVDSTLSHLATAS
ncbi:MAG: hypothetical protein ACRCYU_01805 [Nocardioides sp.]